MPTESSKRCKLAARVVHGLVSVKKTVVLNLVVFCVVNFEKSRFETIFAVFVILQLQEVETQLSTTRCRRRQQAVDIMEICGHFIRSKVSDVSYVNK